MEKNSLYPHLQSDLWPAGFCISILQEVPSIYLTQGQIALHHSTAQYLSSVRSDVVSEVRDQTAGRKLGISLSLWNLG